MGEITPLRLRVGLGGTLVAGVVPAPSPGAELVLGVARGAFGVLAHGQRLWGQRRDATDALGVDVDAYGVALMATYEPLSFAALQLGPTLTSLSGRARGSALEVAGEGRAVRYGIALALEAALPLPAGFRLAAAFALDGALSRPSFEVARHGRVYRVPAWATGARLRLLHEF